MDSKKKDKNKLEVKHALHSDASQASLMKSSALPEPSTSDKVYRRERDAMVASTEGIELLIKECLAQVQEK
jgi:hypothetical protein